jgi:hypothetical protein
MKFAIAMAALMLGSAAVYAADDAATDQSGAAAGGGKRWAACAADLEKFCANIEHGKGKKRECLSQHQSELSDGCKTSMAKHAAKAAAPDGAAN